MSLDDDDWDDDCELDGRGLAVLVAIAAIFFAGFFVGSHYASRHLAEAESETRSCRLQLRDEKETHAAYRDQVREQFESLFRECGDR